ncbi:MAG TPA: gephyrin-like molybdotransferase Glp [Bacteroidota bacterium]|nr:gephyrin-like molybdotransferase Glp [Bacteroidota bacterium]
MSIPTFIPANEGLRIILSNLPLLPVETRKLLDAHSAVLAKDIIATHDVPPYDCSSMDGFALRAADTREAVRVPVSLNVVGELAAGDSGNFIVQPQTAVRIMTGASIPEGSDAVLEQELVTIRNGSILLNSAVASGRNIRRKGEDIRVGDCVLKKGTLLRAFHLGVIASQGIQEVEVFRTPNVSILTTGNELADVDEKGNVRRDSNRYSLWGLVRECSGKPILLNRARDNEQELQEKIQDGLRHDVLITTGGVSVGKYDFVLNVLEEIGVEIKFWKLRIKPGMPIAFGVYADRGRRVPVFALPGNPVSAGITFLEFVKPGLQAMQGRQPDPPVALWAISEQGIPKKDSKRHFLRGVVRNHNGEFVVRTTGNQSSGVLTSMIEANCLIVLPEDSGPIEQGTKVEIHLL